MNRDRNYNTFLTKYTSETLNLIDHKSVYQNYGKF